MLLFLGKIKIMQQPITQHIRLTSFAETSYMLGTLAKSTSFSANMHSHTPLPSTPIPSPNLPPADASEFILGWRGRGHEVLFLLFQAAASTYLRFRVWMFRMHGPQWNNTRIILTDARYPVIDAFYLVRTGGN